MVFSTKDDLFQCLFHDQCRLGLHLNTSPEKPEQFRREIVWRNLSRWKPMLGAVGRLIRHNPGSNDKMMKWPRFNKVSSQGTAMFDPFWQHYPAVPTSKPMLGGNGETAYYQRIWSTACFDFFAIDGFPHCKAWVTGFPRWTSGSASWRHLVIKLFPFIPCWYMTENEKVSPPVVDRAILHQPKHRHESSCCVCPVPRETLGFDALCPKTKPALLLCHWRIHLIHYKWVRMMQSIYKTYRHRSSQNQKGIISTLQWYEWIFWIARDIWTPAMVGKIPYPN